MPWELDKPKLKTSMSTVAVPAATAIQILGPSEKRRGVHFSNSASGAQCRVSNLGTVSAAVGISINGLAGAPTDFMDYDRWGDCVRRPWFAFGTTAFTMHITEVLEL